MATETEAQFELAAEFDRIVAGECITDDVARHQEVVAAIRRTLRADAAPREQELKDTEALLRLKAELLESAEKECDELAVYLREMMRAYEQRIRSDCTPAQLKQKPWRVAEYVAAEEALAARAEEVK